MTPVQLARHEEIVAVVPQFAAGPGWTNRPLWLHIINHVDGRYRCECIQPEDQTSTQHVLFPVLAAAHAAMLAQIKVKKAKK